MCACQDSKLTASVQVVARLFLTSQTSRQPLRVAPRFAIAKLRLAGAHYALLHVRLPGLEPRITDPKSVVISISLQARFGEQYYTFLITKTQWYAVRMELSERYIKQLEQEGFTQVYEWQDKPGTVYKTHIHLGKVSLLVTDGSIVFDSKGEKKELKAGERFDVPPGVPHSAVVGPTGWIVIVGEEVAGDS